VRGQSFAQRWLAKERHSSTVRQGNWIGCAYIRRWDNNHFLSKRYHLPVSGPRGLGGRERTAQGPLQPRDSLATELQITVKSHHLHLQSTTFGLHRPSSSAQKVPGSRSLILGHVVMWEFILSEVPSKTLPSHILAHGHRFDATQFSFNSKLGCIRSAGEVCRLPISIGRLRARSGTPFTITHSA
jgi:hypothetical protein